MSMVEPLSPWAESNSDDAPVERQLSRLFSAVPAPAAEPTPPQPPSSAAFAATPAPVQSSRLGLEAASLEAALSVLRAGGSEAALRALSALEQHLRDFPHGSLELEARVARVDALLV